MKIEHLSYILEVAKCRSINKASLNLFLSQQQLSRYLKNAEEELDFTFFERSNLGISLTSKGQESIQIIENIVKLYNELLSKSESNSNDLSSEITGSLSLLTSANLFNAYSKLINEFTINYPKVNLNTEISSDKRILEIISQDSKKLGIIKQLTYNNINYYDIPPNLNFYSPVNGYLVVYAANNHPLTLKNKTISLKQLSKYPLIIYNPYSDNELDIMLDILINYFELNIKVNYLVSELQLFHNILKQGTCISIGINKPNYINLPHVTTIPIKEKILFKCGLLSSKELKTSKAYEVFTNFYQSYSNKLI